MANEQNLIPFNKRAESEQREIRSKGGKARAAKARKRKAVREVMEMIANQPVTNDKLKKQMKAITGEIDEEDIDMITAATMGIFQAAIKGNVSAYEMIADKLDESKVEDETEEDELSKALREWGESL